MKDILSKYQNHAKIGLKYHIIDEETKGSCKVMVIKMQIQKCKDMHITYMGTVKVIIYNSVY